MAEAVAVVEQARIDTMTVADLRTLCKQLGITGYSAMKKDEIVAAIRVKQAPVEPVDQGPLVIQTAGPAAEEPAAKPKTWVDNFISELQNVCTNLEALPNTNFLPEELSEVVTRVKEAATVDDLAQLDEEVLMGYIHMIKQQLPRYQRDVYETVNLISGARPMTVDVDFV